jgi:serine/threonine-protein kinase HipA
MPTESKKNIAGSARSPLTFAEVLLHTPQAPAPVQVGWLSRAGDNLRVSFHEQYIGNPSRPTLSQLYRGRSEADTLAIMRAVNDVRLVRIGRLPVFFENMLPEGHNRERLAARRGVEVDDEFELLAAAGHDLIGAVEVLPARDVPHDVLELHATKGLEPLAANAVAAPVVDGFSIAGYVTKFSMVHTGHRYVIRRGTAAGEILAKLPSTHYTDMVLNEGACYRLAEAVGIRTAGATVRPIAELDIPDEALVPFTEYLHVPRFDRRRLEDGTVKRVHFEELTQALGLESRRKYKDLHGAMVALLIGLQASDAAGQDDIDEVFRRWTAYALMGNTDAHAKNWGLLYQNGRDFTLAPAYDMVCVAAYFDPDDHVSLAQNRKMDEALHKWDEDEAEALAKEAGLLNFNRARRVVRDTRKLAAAAWPAILETAPRSVAAEVSRRLGVMAPRRLAGAHVPKS